MPLIAIPKDARLHRAPCGECHLPDGETCDICGAYQTRTTREVRERARELATAGGYVDDYDRAVLMIIDDLEALLRQRHLTTDAKQDTVALLRNALTDCAEQLAHCLGPDTEAGRAAREALEATE